MEAIEVTIDELREILAEAGNLGARAVTIQTETVPKMRKTDNPYWDKDNKLWSIVKRSRVNGMINWVYGNSVNNQREREGKEPDFEPQPRYWGERIEGTPLVEHKDRHYLELKVERSLDSKLYDDTGGEVDFDEVDEFLYKKSQAKTQKTEKEIVLRDYRLDSILAINMNGKRYVVVDK